MKCENCDKSCKVKYCSVSCQQQLQKRLKIEKWLRTGIAEYVGSKANHYIKEYIFNAQNGRCGICYIPSIWNELELVFVLDHIDGNSTNNARNNLRLICPNCDSQLPTYKARNRGNGRHSRRVRYSEGKSY